MRSRLAAVIAALILVPTLVSCSQDDASVATDSGDTGSSGASGSTGSTESGTCSYDADGSPAAREVEPPPTQPSTSRKVSIDMKTSEGVMRLLLDPAKATCTVNNFVSLAEQGYFDNTLCHRLVASDAMGILQCGDPSATGSGGPGYRFADELSGSETYPAGTVAMANAGPNTNGSQFFLVFTDTPLDPAYTVFGKVDAASIKLLRKIAARGNGADGVAPKVPVKIDTVSVR